MTNKHSLVICMLFVYHNFVAPNRENVYIIHTGKGKSSYFAYIDEGVEVQRARCAVSGRSRAPDC